MEKNIKVIVFISISAAGTQIQLPAISGSLKDRSLLAS